MPKINIVHTYQNSAKAKGLTVVIDVYRAFSTACYIMNQKPEKFLVTADINYALELKQNYANAVLIGERNSIKIEGFNYTNSPSEVEKLNLKGKTVIFNTSAGTQGVIKAVNASDIITGSFVNVDAILNYIITKNPEEVSLVCTNADLVENEDVFLAEYVKHKLEGNDTDLYEVITRLKQHSCSSWFYDPTKTSHPIEDLELCLDFNKFNFVLKAKKINENLFELNIA